jgi:hypothetical protein
MISVFVFGKIPDKFPLIFLPDKLGLVRGIGFLNTL